MYSCFECNSYKNIHHHHVVPKVKGGTKTLPLCEECHGKVHGEHMLKIQRLAKIGRQKKVKENLDKGLPSGLGRPFNTSETIEQFLHKPVNIKIKKMVLKGYKVKDITKLLSVSNKTVIKVRKHILTK